MPVPRPLHQATLALSLLFAATGVRPQQNPNGQIPIGSVGNPLILLLRDDVVLKDIEATAEQREQLAAMADDLDAIVWPLRNQPPEQRIAAWDQATAQANRQASQILTLAQRKRLQQIPLWIQGTRALARDDVARALKLSDEQRDAIGAILEATAEKVSDLQQRAASGSDPELLNEQANELLQTEQKQTLSKLTPEQQATWARIVGPPIDVQQLGRVSFRAPELIGDPEDWVNAASPGNAFTGRVTVVHFFANACINCQNNYEHYVGWQERFRDEGLVIVGIHTPEVQAEYDVELLKKKASEAGFEFPILVDNDKQNWNAWGNSMWPSVYLVDREGRIRYWWYGELNWEGQQGEQMLRQRITELLAKDR